MTKLTPQELDERIAAMKAVYDITAHPDFVTDLKLIIRDCIEAVTPERITGRDLVAVKGSPELTHDAAVSNIILDLVEQKTKELLG